MEEQKTFPSQDMVEPTLSSSSIGILIVGLGGANGSTLAAGLLANRHNIQWFGPRGEHQTPNYNGCITQLTPRGVHPGVGYKGKYKGSAHYLELADANDAVIGGWDIRPNKLGDALLDAQILDYDLVRQLRDELNKIQILKGYYDPRFIGSSQHEGATYTLDRSLTAKDALELLRRDIRNFKQENHIMGHTTVIWSASVEPNCPLCFEHGGLDTADQLMQSIAMSEEERGGPLPPSLIYATAAILEGCSFVNGGSQYTLCRGLTELSRQERGVYCLGTDFKAGQTKFKTAAVEYLRTMGLQPKVIASSNHLGNNDMYNLATSDTACMAKLRVKNDIFSTWEEDIDHKVSVMYTPFINDEKRDFVEYTSLAFLNQIHTMVTYTRASDSVLCVPLMIDAAVWCDYFSVCEWALEDVAKALAYLFKVPAVKGVDPGFFRQMRELDDQFYRANCYLNANPHVIRKRTLQQLSVESPSVYEPKSSIVHRLPKPKMMIPSKMSIICAGLACVDMQLLSATNGNGSEAIETFCRENTTCGGSVSMACKTLSKMTYSHLIDDGPQLSPVVHRVIPLCKVGSDNAGDTLLQLFRTASSFHHNVDTYFIENARKLHTDIRTALAVLPIYQDGKRGCFFDAASNTTFSCSEIIDSLDEILSDRRTGLPLDLGAFLFGYPHLLPMMQGQALYDILNKARSCGCLIAVDLNGLPTRPLENSAHFNVAEDPVLSPAFHLIDILHLNEDELSNLTGLSLIHESEGQDGDNLCRAAELILDCGVAIVLVTRGANGCYIKCNDQIRFDQSPTLPKSWIGRSIQLKAPNVEEGSTINCNGAGDAFTSGFLVATMLRRLDSDDHVSTAESLNLEVAAQFASLVALRHICSSTRDCDCLIIDDLLELSFNQI